MATLIASPERPILLGTGAFGQVYQVSLTGKDGNTVQVARKYFYTPSGLSQKKAESEAVASLTREERIFSILSEEPKAPYTAEMIQSNSRKRYIDMKLAPGRNLAKWMKREWAVLGMDLAKWMKKESLVLSDIFTQVMRVAGQILDALISWGEKGLIHRDIKPENIVFDGNLATLVDVGISGQVDCRGRLCQGEDSWVGTHGYQAPEMWQISADLRRVDIWSLGSTLMELICVFLIPDHSALKWRSEKCYWGVSNRLDTSQIKILPEVKPDLVCLARLVFVMIREMLTIPYQQRPSADELKKRFFIVSPSPVPELEGSSGTPSPSPARELEGSSGVDQGTRPSSASEAQVISSIPHGTKILWGFSAACLIVGLLCLCVLGTAPIAAIAFASFAVLFLLFGFLVSEVQNHPALLA